MNNAETANNTLIITKNFYENLFELLKFIYLFEPNILHNFTFKKLCKLELLKCI